MLDLKKFTIPALVFTSDRVASIYFDAVGWLEEQDSEVITELVDFSFGPCPLTEGLVKAYYDTTTKDLLEYLIAVRVFKEVDYRCWLSIKACSVWLKTNRTILYNTLRLNPKREQILVERRDHPHFATKNMILF